MTGGTRKNGAVIASSTISVASIARKNAITKNFGDGRASNKTWFGSACTCTNERWHSGQTVASIAIPCPQNGQGFVGTRGGATGASNSISGAIRRGGGTRRFWRQEGQA